MNNAWILQHIFDALERSISLFCEAAPWLLLGLLVAGALRALMPNALVVRWTGGRGLGAIIRAALIGLPLPLCSCSVIPVGLQLHRSGASREATTAFFIATPETGADSVGLSWVLLGPWLTVARPLAALASAVTTALVGRWVPASSPRPGACEARADRSAHSASACCGPALPATAPAASGCCAAAGVHTAERATGCQDEPAGTRASTCCSHDTPPAASVSLGQRLQAGWGYALTNLLDEFKGWLVIGLLVAGAVLVFVPPSLLASVGDGWLAMGVLLAISIPVYVCATESTPIATALLAAGVAPGAVLVFLLAGPATNIATIRAMQREFGRLYALVYVVSVSACALAAGAITQRLLAGQTLAMQHATTSTAGAPPGALSLVAGALLAFLMWPRLRDPLLRRLGLTGVTTDDCC